MKANKDLFRFTYKTQQMKHRLISIITVSVIFIFGTGCKQNNMDQSPKKEMQDSVSVFMLKKQNINKQFTFPSELSALDKAEVFAKVSGYIKTIKVDIGDHVKQGQLIAQLEAPEIVSNYEQANAEVQTAHSKYLGSLDTYNRILSASKVDGTVAAVELEKAKTNMLADRSVWDASKSKLNSFAELKNYLTITSPFKGVVTQRNADAGALVGSATQKPIVVIENTNVLRLRVPVPEAYTATLPDSSFIAFTVDAQPNKKYYAELSRKNDMIGKDNRTETWEFLFKNDKEELKSGMYANAIIKLGRTAASFAVASSAIATTLEKKFVIRLKNGRAEWVDVRNGMNLGDKIEVFGNLNEGDTLLMKATDEIKSGVKLNARF